LSQVHASIDGTFVEMERKTQNMPFEYRFLVHRRRVSTPTTLEFVVHETISPSETGRGDDNRKLGVIFRDLTFTRLPI
jgi:hypothetical protein